LNSYRTYDKRERVTEFVVLGIPVDECILVRPTNRSGFCHSGMKVTTFLCTIAR
jgi:hypothetical protein